MESIVNYAHLRAKDQLRMTIATQILAQLALGNNIIWTHDPDACSSDVELTDRAIEFADLLLKRLSQSESK